TVESQGFYNFDLSADWAARPGTWTVALVVDGNRLAADDFTIADPGQSVIRVDASSAGFVANGRTTPIDLTAAAPTQTFTVTNLGTDTLTLSPPALPAGFSLAGGFPSSIGPGGSDTFTVVENGGAADGVLAFSTNDPDAATFSFNLRADGGTGTHVPSGPVPLGAFAAGAGAGGAAVVLYNPDRSPRLTAQPFAPAFRGGVRVAVGDVDGDGSADLVVASGPGGPPLVEVLDGNTGAVKLSLMAFESSFTGGLFVAVADLNGDGCADLVVTPDEGGGPRVTVYSGKDGSVLANFFGIDDPNFRGGCRAAVGDVNADGVPDLVVSAGFGGGPRVAVFDGRSVTAGGTPGRLVNDFFAFDGPDVQTLRNGVYVAAGDLDGDGYADLAFGGGPFGGPRVLVLSGKAVLSGNGAGGPASPLANFFAGDENERSGIRVAMKDVTGDGRTDLLAGGSSEMFLYSGASLVAGSESPVFHLAPFPGFTGGVFVG
ncbi:MAG TPA: FG-GAP-like repeat-containing protein, partial [Urbifossiella sp.]|nr:FG-GAP-like repeat-containing protein [Urbifossiella sp.]